MDVNASEPLLSEELCDAILAGDVSGIRQVRGEQDLSIEIHYDGYWNVDYVLLKDEEIEFLKGLVENQSGIDAVKRFSLRVFLNKVFMDSVLNEFTQALIEGDLKHLRQLIEEEGFDMCGVYDLHWDIERMLPMDTHVEILRYLVENRVDAPRAEHFWIRILDWAMACEGRWAPDGYSSNSFELALYFVEQGIDLHFREGVSIYWASIISTGNLELVRYLVEEQGYEALVHKKDELGYYDGSPTMYYAICSHSLEILKYFVEVHGVDVKEISEGNRPLEIAASYGTSEALRYLIEERNAHIEDLACLLARAAGSWERFQTPLALEKVKYLIEECGADPNEIGAESNSALCLAADEENMDVVRYLVEVAKADVNIVEFSGRKVLDCAPSPEVIRYLIDHGARPIRSVLGGVVRMGDLELMQYLIEKYAVDVKDFDVVAAVYSGNLELVKYLVEGFGASLDSDSSCEALCVAVHYGFIELLKYLVDELDLSVEPFSGDCDLMEIGMKKEDFEVLKYLAENGTDMRRVYVDYKRDFDRIENLKIREYLLEAMQKRCNQSWEYGLFSYFYYNQSAHIAAFAFVFELMATPLLNGIALDPLSEGIVAILLASDIAGSIVVRWICLTEEDWLCYCTSLVGNSRPALFDLNLAKKLKD